ncbi:MAG: transferase hexapeptide repeat containing protein [Candidatus Magasanikbacteria bacterium]|nr:transferase hexapeptide repeat containing protein [Candidatus Magasanikbacteria bacterium]
MTPLEPDYYFDLASFSHRQIFESGERDGDAISLLSVIAAIARLEIYTQKNLQPQILGIVMDGARVEKNVFIDEGTVIQPGAWVVGPSIIGKNCEIRHSAYVGANTLLGDNVVIGHASEVSHSIFLNGSRAAHFAFVGHSILGNNVNLGAGVKLANYKLDGSEIKIDGVSTELNKFGAIIGDNSSLGCNAVTQPGTLIGPRVRAYPLTLLRGFLPADSVIKKI